MILFCWDGRKSKVYVLNIAKQGKSPIGASPKDLIFSSKHPCLKFLNLGKREFTINSGQTLNFEENIGVSFPFLPLVFLYQPQLGQYKAATPEMLPNYFNDYLHFSYSFDENKLYVSISNYTGANRTTHYYWFIGYA